MTRLIRLSLALASVRVAGVLQNFADAQARAVLGEHSAVAVGGEILVTRWRDGEPDWFNLGYDVTLREALADTEGKR
jgi:hypothetical protein